MSGNNVLITRWHILYYLHKQSNFITYIFYNCKIKGKKYKIYFYMYKYFTFESNLFNKLFYIRYIARKKLSAPHIGL